MSKVRIYGDTSGYVDIAVPAVAGTTTLNLDKIPQADISGNIAMDTDTLFVDAANNRVGIGTTSPDQKMHLYTGAGTTLYKAEVNANSTVGLEIKKTGSTTQSWRIVDGETVNGALQFYDVTDSRVSMQIDGSGALLVGKTAANFATAGTEINASGRTFMTYDGGGPLQLNRKTSFGDIIELHKDGAEVGAIGSPYGNELYIEGTGANSSGLLFTSGNSIQPRKNNAADDGNIDIGTSGNKFKDLYLSGSITANNIAASGAASSFNSGATNVVASFTSSDATAGIQLADNTGNVELSALGSTFQVQPGGGTATLSVSSQLSEPIMTVVGGGYGYTHGAIALKSWNGYDARVRGQGIFLFNEENDTTWYAGTPYLNTTAGSRPFDFNFQSGTTSLSAITASSPTYTAFRVHASGVISSVAGIELGSGVDATAANTLDDYEEGTWTPTITGYNGGSTQTYSTQTGNYIKIGNQIFANFYVALSNKGNIAGNYTGIGGLPFPTKTAVGGTGVLNRYSGLASAVSGVAVEMGGGVPTWGWLTRTNGTSGTSDGYLPSSQLQNNTWFMGTLIYQEQ